LAELKYQEVQKFNRRNANHCCNWVLRWEEHHYWGPEHLWQVEAIKFPKPLLSKKLIGSPYLSNHMYPQQNYVTFIQNVILLITQHSYEIRETCKCNVTEGNQFLLGSTPFKPRDYKWEKTGIDRARIPS
jgi:hypothetical protein